MKKCTSLMLAAVLTLSASAFAFQAPAPKDAKAAKAAPAAKAAATAAPSGKEIADAKAKGMVWVNTSSKVYHKDGAFYGKTKKGKFMTEADAKKAGNRAAKAPTPPKEDPKPARKK